MRRLLAAAALAAVALICAGCSDNTSTSPTTSSPPTRAGSGLDAAKYLSGLDGDKHTPAQVDALLAKLGTHCTDDLGVLASAATVTAVDVTDAKGVQSTYGVLETLADGLPPSGKVACQHRLPAVEKHLKAGR